MCRLKVLLLTHRVPYPPNRGDRIRAYHLLRFLAARHEVSLACLADEPYSAETEQHLRQTTARLAIARQSASRRWLRAAWNLATGGTATSGMFASTRLRRALRAWSQREKFDCIIAFCSSMAPYAFLPQWRDTPVLIDLVDVDSQKWLDYSVRARGFKRFLYGIEGRRLRGREQDLAKRASAIVLVSEPEADLFRSFCPNDKTHAITNGVDLEYFRPTSEATATRPASCVFVGALDYGANIDGLQWFCSSVWPEVKRAEPTASLEIVGRAPTRAIERLASLPGVSLTANAADVRPSLQRAAVAIAPLQIARGIQNKVLEAMAMGKAVVASPGATTGLNAVAGAEIVVAETAEQWVAALRGLWNSDSQRAALGIQARAFAQREHSWEATLAPWRELLEQSQASRSPGAFSAPLRERSNFSLDSTSVGKIERVANGETF